MRCMSYTKVSKMSECVQFEAPSNLKPRKVTLVAIRHKTVRRRRRTLTLAKPFDSCASAFKFYRKKGAAGSKQGVSVGANVSRLPNQSVKEVLFT